MTTRKSKRGGAIVATSAIPSAPEISTFSKKATIPQISMKTMPTKASTAETDKIATAHAIVAVFGAIKRINDAMKAKKQVEFTKEEAEYIGQSVGWLYLLTFNTENDIFLYTLQGDELEAYKKHLNEPIPKVPVLTTEQLKQLGLMMGGSGTLKQQGGMIPAVGGIIAALYIIITGMQTSDVINARKADLDIVKLNAANAIASKCNVPILNELPPDLVYEPSLFGLTTSSVPTQQSVRAKQLFETRQEAAQTQCETERANWAEAKGNAEEALKVAKAQTPKNIATGLAMGTAIVLSGGTATLASIAAGGAPATAAMGQLTAALAAAGATQPVVERLVSSLVNNAPMSVADVGSMAQELGKGVTTVADIQSKEAARLAAVAEAAKPPPPKTANQLAQEELQKELAELGETVKTRELRKRLEAMKKSLEEDSTTGPGVTGSAAAGSGPSGDGEGEVSPPPEPAASSSAAAGDGLSSPDTSGRTAKKGKKTGGAKTRGKKSKRRVTRRKRRATAVKFVY